MTKANPRRILKQALKDEADALRGIIRSYALKMGIATPADADRIADEILSDTATKAIEKAAAFDTDRRPIPWLLGIAMNCIRQRRTQQQRRNQREINVRDLYRATEANHSDDELFDQFSTWVSQPSTLEVQQHIKALLAPLSANDRELLQLAIIEELDSQTIADKLNLTATNVRVRVHRILKRLRRQAHLNDLEKCV